MGCAPSQNRRRERASPDFSSLPPSSSSDDRRRPWSRPSGASKHSRPDLKRRSTKVTRRSGGRIRPRGDRGAMKRGEGSPAGTAGREGPGKNHPAGVEALEAIRLLADTLHETLEFDVVAERALESILAYAPFVAASIFSLSESEDELELVAARGFRDQVLQATTTLPLDTSLVGYALREGRVFLSDDLAVETRGLAELRAALLRDGYDRALIVPTDPRKQQARDPESRPTRGLRAYGPGSKHSAVDRPDRWRWHWPTPSTSSDFVGVSCATRWLRRRAR